MAIRKLCYCIETARYAAAVRFGLKLADNYSLGLGYEFKSSQAPKARLQSYKHKHKLT